MITGALCPHRALSHYLVYGTTKYHAALYFTREPIGKIEQNFLTVTCLKLIIETAKGENRSVTIVRLRVGAKESSPLIL